MGVPYRIVVEAPQVDAYAQRWGRDRLLVLDPDYKEAYDTLDDEGGSFSRGSGPARNFIWEHSIAEGHTHHWIMDDNIYCFYRLHQNQKLKVGDGHVFRAMEDFALRYVNLAMCGPQYHTFAHARKAWAPYVLNTRIYSCNLIRNDVPLRWRGRYNEDTILSLDMLKAGWCTAQFNAFLQSKAHTLQMAGGNLEAFYGAKGTAPKSEMLARVHPDVAKVITRFGRPHHWVDYRPFRQPLVRRPDYVPPTDNPYRGRLVERPETRG
jgi:hypothetical protein